MPLLLILVLVVVAGGLGLGLHRDRGLENAVEDQARELDTQRVTLENQGARLDTHESSIEAQGEAVRRLDERVRAESERNDAQGESITELEARVETVTGRLSDVDRAIEEGRSDRDELRRQLGEREALAKELEELSIALRRLQAGWTRDRQALEALRERVEELDAQRLSDAERLRRIERVLGIDDPPQP